MRSIRANVTFNPGAAVANTYQRDRIAHWDRVAHDLPDGSRAGREYHRCLRKIYAFLVRPGLRVVEFGCGSGDLLASLRPSLGVGIDFSAEMLRVARNRHQGLKFVEADVHNLPALEGPFDVVILSDLVNDLYDVQGVLQQAYRLCSRGTRLILNVYSHLWEWPLGAAARLGLATPRLQQNWLTPDDLSNLLDFAGFELVRSWQEILAPLPIPLLRSLANRYLVKLWPFRWFALTSLVIARPLLPPPEKLPVVSVIVPTRNEEGNIPEIFERLPEMGAGTEIIFVEGHSRDDTYGAIQRGMAYIRTGGADSYARPAGARETPFALGFAEATGDILMILDADLTVPPEDLPRSTTRSRRGKGDS